MPSGHVSFDAGAAADLILAGMGPLIVMAGLHAVGVRIEVGEADALFHVMAALEFAKPQPSSEIQACHRTEPRMDRGLCDSDRSLARHMISPGPSRGGIMPRNDSAGMAAARPAYRRRSTNTRQSASGTGR